MPPWTSRRRVLLGGAVGASGLLGAFALRESGVIGGGCTRIAPADVGRDERELPDRDWEVAPAPTDPVDVVFDRASPAEVAPGESVGVLPPLAGEILDLARGEHERLEHGAGMPDVPVYQFDRVTVRGETFAPHYRETDSMSGGRIYRVHGPMDRDPEWDDVLVACEGSLAADLVKSGDVVGYSHHGGERGPATRTIAEDYDAIAYEGSYYLLERVGWSDVPPQGHLRLRQSDPDATNQIELQLLSSSVLERHGVEVPRATLKVGNTVEEAGDGLAALANTVDYLATESVVAGVDVRPA